MKRGENSGSEKPENLGEKLKKEWKIGGHTTPVIPFWRIQEQEQISSSVQGDDGVVKDNIIQHISYHNNPCVSARKLGATLWELDHYKLPLSMSMSMMQQNPVNGGGGGALPRIRHHHRGGLEPSDPSPDLPESASTLRRHVAASIIKHHRAIERNNHAIQPVSPASYSSSMEIAPQNYEVTPTKTSSELLKVLNRIWSLEEQHASNISLVKELKKELNQAQIRIKELMRDKRGINEIMKQFDEDKLARKNKERDRINKAVKSVRDELEDERKLRKRSETLHRRLAREIYEVKTSFIKERKSRMLLEDLCDEFALGIRDYEQELHGTKRKFNKDWGENAILHLSESWLDERIQMKEKTQNGSILDKLSSEIETFLQIKRKSDSKNIRRSTHELNIAASAPPREEEDDNDSIGSDSHCFELPKEFKPIENEENQIISKKSEIEEVTEKRDVNTVNESSNFVINNLIKSQHMSEGQEIDGKTIWTSQQAQAQASPIKQWTNELPDMESCSKVETEMKDNSLKAKLIEARLKGNRTRSRLKGSKVSF